MADPRGFLTHDRAPSDRRDPRERVGDYREIFVRLPDDEVRRQASRCMDCGVAFCHRGCPLGNRIPRWNELVTDGDWRQAIAQLHATNDFPEFTGYTCPAPCEPACVLEINDDPVMIKQVELSIIEKAFDEGWVSPDPPERRTGRSVGVVGSGPAGLAVAAQLNDAGHRVVVYERDEAPGGLLRRGIPDFKLEKPVVDRRVDLLAAEGITFRCGTEVGADLPAARLTAEHDAVVLATGARVQRPLDIPGADLGGVVDAMDYLYQRNRAVARAHGRPAPPEPTPEETISAAGKQAVVIGGGDTAADCIANAHREQAAGIVQLDRYPEPAGSRPREITDWPQTPKRLPTTYAQEEGGRRRWGQTATALIGAGGQVTAVRAASLSPPDFTPVDGTEFTLPADLVIVAIGFLGPEHGGPVAELDVDVDEHGRLSAAESFATQADGVFATGDARRGPSLVVWAIDEGRRCARAVDRYLTGRTQDGPTTPQPATWPPALSR